MDASHVVPCPGNPEDETYEDSAPDLSHPFVITLGHVSGKASHFPEGSRTFPLTVSDYVRDNTQMITIRYVDLYFMHLFHHSTLFQSAVFNSTRPRWKNTNIPFPGTIVLIIGQCAHVLDRDNPPALKEIYLAKYFGDLIYFGSHTILDIAC